MSKIVVTGATGVIGWRAVAQLIRQGHDVTGVTRSPRGRALLTTLGAHVVDADVFDPLAVRRAFAGAEVVVNLLTHIPPAERMGDPAAWAENDRLRGHASAVIARAAGKIGVERLVQESVAFLYAEGASRWLDEDAPVAVTRSTASALIAERNASELFAGDSVILRFGQFIGPDSELTLDELAQARSGVATRLGHAQTRVPTVWLNDAAIAVAYAVSAPPGVYNIVDDDPPTRALLEQALAAAAGRASLRITVVPEAEPMSRSLRLSNQRFRQATGWAPRVRGGVDGWSLISEQRLAA
jgi:nucleoside-diphosphate-sugar epimerase